MTTDELAKIVMERIDYLGGGYSIVEMRRDLTKHIRVDGDMGYFVSDNLVLWTGVSEAFCDVLDYLRNNHLIEMVPAQWMVYLLDGECLRYPVAKRIPKNGYKTIHWLPVTMSRAKEVENG